MTTVRKRLSWLALLCSVACGGFLLYYANRMSLAEYRADQIIEHTPVGVMVCDTDGRAVRVNQALSDITGFSSRELLHGGASILIPPEFRERHTKKFGEAIAEYAHSSRVADRAYTKILAVQCKDGQQIRATVSVSTIRTGRAVEFFAFITPVVSAEQDLTRNSPRHFKN